MLRAIKQIKYEVRDLSLLENAKKQDIKRLLDSFPVSTLKDAWSGIKGTKEEICFGAAEERDLRKIIDFMQTNFGRCRQHVYVLVPPDAEVDPLGAITDGEIVGVDHGKGMLILAKAVFSVFLRDPLEDSTVEFLWPIKIETRGQYLLLSLIVLERNPCVYFDRDCYQVSRSIDERGIVKNLEALGYERADLHKGIKALWDENFIDSFRTRYRKPKSTASEDMDEELGIKQHNPQLYEQLQTATLFTTLFQVDPSTECCVETFQVDPSAGYIAFPRYTEGTGDSDDVVQRILEKNL